MYDFLYAEFLGFLVSNGRMILSSNSQSLTFSSKEIFILRKVLEISNKLNIKREKDIVLNEGDYYLLELKGVKENFEIEKIREAVINFNQENKKAFIRGIYLGCGILSSPPSYHLELRFENSHDLELAASILKDLKVKHSVSELKIYIKGRENIKQFLFDVKANDAYILLEEDAVKKEISNRANRKANFEFANLERQTASSTRILNILEKIRDKGDLEKLREDLKEVAILRLSYPLLSLKELSEKTNGKLTKQGIYYRLKRIEKAYGE